ncbi:MAG TPA: hypothetical protein VM659_00255 [Dongiaceae bacterium]|nr:hypothetical protein [Dongiaceae bacterium]
MTSMEDLHSAMMRSTVAAKLERHRDKGKGFHGGKRFHGRSHAEDFGGWLSFGLHLTG